MFQEIRIDSLEKNTGINNELVHEKKKFSATRCAIYFPLLSQSNELNPQSQRCVGVGGTSINFTQPCFITVSFLLFRFIHFRSWFIISIPVNANEIV